MKYCSMCAYCTGKEEDLVAHVCTIHRYHPNFQVYCASCLRSYSKWTTYKKHLSRGCSVKINEDPPAESSTLDLSPTVDSFGEDTLDDNSVVIPSQEWLEAAYILYIKENHVVTQSAIDTILPHTNQLFESLLEKVSRELKTKLSDEAMDFVQQAHRNVLPLFSSLSTSYLQRKFFKDHFPLVVSFLKVKFSMHVILTFRIMFQEPVSMLLGIKRVWRRVQHTRRKVVTVKREFYYVPLQDALHVSVNISQLQYTVKRLNSRHFEDSNYVRCTKIVRFSESLLL